METTYPLTYLSRVIPLPATVAADALDRIRRAGTLDPAAAVEPGDWMTVTTDAGALQLARRGPRHEPPRLLPVGRVPGRLRTALPWPTVAVELEVVLWSAGRTEIGLRYVSAVHRRGLRLYHSIGGPALDQIGVALGTRRSHADTAPRRRSLVA